MEDMPRAQDGYTGQENAGDRGKYRAGFQGQVWVQDDRIAGVAAGERERAFRAMWRKYYQTIAIEGRTNPKCQSTHMPKRYRHVMTEFLTDEEMERALPKGGAGARPLGEGRMVPPQI